MTCAPACLQGHVARVVKEKLLSHPHPELGPPPKLPKGGLRVTPLGGLGEIGRNMTVFEFDVAC